MKPRQDSRKAEFELDTPENRLVNVHIGRAARRMDFPEALSAFHGANFKNGLLYGAIINAAAYNQEFEAGLELFQQMKQEGIDYGPALISAVLKIYGAQGNYIDAKRVYEEELERDSEMLRNNSCLNGLLSAAACEARVDAVLEEMTLAVQRGIQLDKGHYSCLIRAYREAKNAQGAISTLRVMHEKRLKPTVFEYTQVLGAVKREYAYTRDRPKAKSNSDIVMSYMAQDRVSRNEYFLEEEVALCLGVDRLKSVPKVLIDTQFKTSEAVSRGLEMIDAAESAGLRITRGLQVVRRALREVGRI